MDQQLRSSSPTFNSSGRRRKRKSAKRTSSSSLQDGQDGQTPSEPSVTPKRLPAANDQHPPAASPTEAGVSNVQLAVSSVFSPCDIIGFDSQLLAASPSDDGIAFEPPANIVSSAWSEFACLFTSSLPLPSPTRLLQVSHSRLPNNTEDVPLLQWPNRALETLAGLSCCFERLVAALADAPEQSEDLSTTQVVAMAKQLHQQFHSLHVYQRVYLASISPSKQQQALRLILPPLLAFADALPTTAIISLRQPHLRLARSLLYDAVLHLAAVALAAAALGCVEEARCLSLSLLRVAMTSQLASLDVSTSPQGSVSEPFHVVLYWLQRTLAHITSGAAAGKLWHHLILHVVESIARQYAVAPVKLR